MAIQTQRDPFFDTQMHAMLQKRSKELIGLGLVCLGLIAAAIMWSYSAQDPNWLVSTDAPVQNWLGRPGASIAAFIVMIAGLGGWGIAVLLFAWGARFCLHAGQDRALGRVIFAPIFVAALSIYMATIPPGGPWVQSHNFGLGGLGGDTVLGLMLTVLPIGSSFVIKLMSLLMAAGVLVFGAFVLGFTKTEMQKSVRFFFFGLVVAYAGLMALVGKGAAGSAYLARLTQAKVADARAKRAEKRQAAAAIAAQQPAVEPVSEDADPSKLSILARMPSLIKRGEAMPEPELPVVDAGFDEIDAPGDERIQAKIADVIKSRVRQSPILTIPTSTPLTKGRGYGPQPLILDTAGQRAEPPLTADAVPADHLTTPTSVAAADLMVEPAMDFLDDVPEAPEFAQPTAAPVPEARKVVQQPARKPAQPSSRAIAEAQPALSFEENHPGFELPPLGLLEPPTSVQRHHLSDEALEENARMLEVVLDDYGVKGDIVSVRPGPVVTMYELEPAPGLKASRVIGLADDTARSMAALSARVSTVPGRSVIGIELPNENREQVLLREILSSRDFGDSNMKLPLALGKDIGGDSVVANLAKMPHLLIAGTTGSGKSVAINTMILSLLYRLTPDECRLIMIDPKMLELSVYDGIPHLLSPVVTDPKKAVVALKWVVGEMEERYRKMSKMGVRNIDGYNGRVREALAKGEMFSRTVQTGFDDDTGEPVFETEEFEPKILPYIVVIVDEMADLMMVAGKEIEACIQRLAQMARASGIHLIMATQRPSVDVITGTIKANFPTRISFQVTSKIDSRTILGEMGAEQLLGMGDMLYMAGGAKITRCHGPFVSDEEVEEIVNHLKGFGPPDYIGGVVEGPADEKADNIDAVLGLNTGGNTNGEDALYDQAVSIVIQDRKCSTSYIQRKLAIGYNKAARLVEQMEDQGLVTPANHVGKREILVPEQ